MGYKQLSIYELAGTDSDPVYQQISMLKMGQNLQIGPFKISKSGSPLYEIEGQGVHECFSSLEKIYQYICINLESKGESEQDE